MQVDNLIRLGAEGCGLISAPHTLIDDPRVRQTLETHMKPRIARGLYCLMKIKAAAKGKRLAFEENQIVYRDACEGGDDDIPPEYIEERHPGWQAISFYYLFLGFQGAV
ncbi:hypothetical protein HDU67_006100 [Dinochytrium kinnereticum]|nr:hypothetical protein HDU67_006100 [Dinochytrium kinnereticum]